MVRAIFGAMALAGAAWSQAFDAAEVRLYQPELKETRRVDFVAGMPVNRIAQVGADSSRNGEAVFAASGAVVLRGATMRQLIRVAYKEVIQDDYVTGGPAWADADSFEVMAKAPAGTVVETERLMLQMVLTERFHLTVHREQKAMPVYALVAGKTGPKLKLSGGAVEPGCKPGAGPGRQPNSMGFHAVCTNASMPELADALTSLSAKVSFLDHPVSDASGIKGRYDFTLEWSPAPPGPDVAGETLRDAVDRLGLKLEERKEPRTVIVIDHVDRVPEEN